MSFLGLYSDKEDALQNMRGRDKYRRRSDSSHYTFRDILGDLQSQSDEAYDEAQLTTGERFGEVLDNISNQVNERSASTQANLTRANMATGGDVSGSTSVGLAETEQRGNRAMQDAFNYYERLNQSANQRSRSRGDRLLSNAARLGQRQYQLDTSNMKDYELRETQRQQADRQTTSGLIGGALKLGASLLCWVAEELYGRNDVRTHILRSYLTSKLNERSVIGMFARIYKRYGKRWADIIRSNSLARSITARAFDVLCVMAIKELSTININKE